MAPMSDDDMAFNAAFAAFKAASSDDERSVASGLLLAELERQKVVLEEAHKKETRAREEAFAREVAALEEKLRRDLKEKDTVAAVRKACVDLCLDKIDSDPEGAQLYANVIQSWAQQPLIEFLMDELRNFYRLAYAGKVFVRAAKMTPEQMNRMAGEFEVILKNRGYPVPRWELSAMLTATVRIEKKRDAKLRYLKDIISAITTASSVLATAFTTLEVLKHATPDDNEPVLSCRHYLPPGWFF